MILFSQCNTKTKEMEKLHDQQDAFIKRYDSLYQPLYKEASQAYYNASISGKTEDFDSATQAQLRFIALYTNKKTFEELKGLMADSSYRDSSSKRIFALIYDDFISNQADEKKLEAIVKLENKVDNEFSVFRAEVNNKKLTDNEIEDILHESTSSEAVKAAWMASKKSGEVVANDVITLVKMRNEIARELGFNNFHQMSLKLDEQDPAQVEKLFDQLDTLTRDAFASEKTKIDSFFARRFNIKTTELRPWHYQNRFFQEAPELYSVNLDSYYKGTNVIDLTRQYYASIGLPLDSILAKSDLYEKEGKNQHAYCINIDIEGDVRMLCNVMSNSYWMGTMLHESGHAIYEDHLDYTMPVTFREPAHTFVTEAIAELFGRFNMNAQWLSDMKLIDPAEKAKIEENCYHSLRLQMLLFSRWSQVMYRFEKSMYENPDQDLNKLWWDLVERYQMLKRPEQRNCPDWASKIHLATSPCYYHNYLLGELLASQLHHYLVKNIIKSDDLSNQSYMGKPEVGKFFSEKIFKPGRSVYWNDLIKNATGEPLTAKYFARQFVN